MPAKKQTIFLPGNLKRLRQRKKLSQEEMAERLGISRVKLTLLETGKTINAPLEDVVNFSTFFGISIDVLLTVDLRVVPELKIREMERGKNEGAGNYLK